MNRSKAFTVAASIIVLGLAVIATSFSPRRCTASASIYNGSGVNPLKLSFVGLPKINTTWQVKVNGLGSNTATVTLFFFRDGLLVPVGLKTPYGYILGTVVPGGIEAAPYLMKSYNGLGFPVTFNISIPPVADCIPFILQAYVQRHGPARPGGLPWRKFAPYWTNAIVGTWGS